MLYEEGRFQLDDPVAAVHPPRFADTRGVCGRRRRIVRDHAARPPGDGARPDDPHLRPHLRVPARAPRRCALPRAPGRVQRQPRTARRPGGRGGGPAAALSAGGARWNYGVSTDGARHGSSRIWSGVPLDTFFEERILRAVGHVRHRLPRAGRAGRPVRVELHARGGRRGSRCTTRRAGAASSNPRAPSPAAARARLHRGGLPPVHAHAPRVRRPRRRPPPRAQERRAHDHEPPPRRPRGHGAAAVLRDALRGHRLRARGVGGAGPGEGPDPRLSPANTHGAAWRAPRSGSIRPRTCSCCCSPQLTPSSTYPIRRELRVLIYQALL